jgi:hypothetical protein
MITLCPTTYEIAQSMPNFSAWVRTQLRLIEVNTPGTVVTLGYMCDTCGDVVHTHKQIEGVPHATRFMGVHKKEDCVGLFRREI